MQGKFGLAPDSVVQTGFLELSSLVDSAFLRATLDSEKWKKKYVQIHLDRKKKSMRRPVESHCQVTAGPVERIRPHFFFGQVQ